MIQVTALSETQVETLVELVNERIEDIVGGDIVVEDRNDEINHLRSILDALRATERPADPQQPRVALFETDEGIVSLPLPQR
jgi:hypothetical protein